MRVTDDRYTQDRLRLDLAQRLIHHEARTFNIRQWIGLSDDRIGNLYRNYCQHDAAAAVMQHRAADSDRRPLEAVAGTMISAARVQRGAVIGMGNSSPSRPNSTYCSDTLQPPTAQELPGTASVTP